MKCVLAGWIVASLLCGVGSAQGASEATAGMDARADSASMAALSWSATYASWYSFQGLDYSGGTPILQPEISASAYGVTLGLWGNCDQSRRELNEVDATIQGERDIGPLTCGLGYAYLRYPNRDWEATHEFVADLALAAPLEPSLSVHWDVGAGGGRYWTLALSREMAVRSVTASLGAKLYAHEHYYGLSGVPAVETNVAVSLPFAGLQLQPALARIWAWENGDFRGEEAIRSRWILGLTFSSP